MSNIEPKDQGNATPPWPSPDTVTLYHVDYHTRAAVLPVTGCDPTLIPPLGGAVHCTSRPVPNCGQLYSVTLPVGSICTLEDIREYEAARLAGSWYTVGNLLKNGQGSLVGSLVHAKLKLPRTYAHPKHGTRKDVEDAFFRRVEEFVRDYEDGFAGNAVRPWDFIGISPEEWRWLAEGILCEVAARMDRGYMALETFEEEFILLAGTRLVRHGEASA